MKYYDRFFGGAVTGRWIRFSIRKGELFAYKNRKDRIEHRGPYIQWTGSSDWLWITGRFGMEFWNQISLRIVFFMAADFGDCFDQYIVQERKVESNILHHERGLQSGLWSPSIFFVRMSDQIINGNAEQIGKHNQRVYSAFSFSMLVVGDSLSAGAQIISNLILGHSV